MKTIFISSTFRDMNEERDLFHARICPELNEIAREYGESISFCDLRWGVNTSTLESEEGSRKVLSVCLDEIDRCKPYMVVLLGQRYGWIPSRELVASTVESRSDFALRELEKSVTALEIEYGALRSEDQLSRTLFYFRELKGKPPKDYAAEDLAHTMKLHKLKSRIRKATGGRVKTYQVRWNAEKGCIDSLDDFAAMVTADIRQLMESDWQALAQLTPHQKDLHGQFEYARQKAAQFTAREDLIEKYMAMLSGGTGLMAVRGPSGSGKSTLMSRLCQALQSAGCDTLPIFCGSTALSTTAMDILQYMTDYLETALALPHFADRQADTAPDLKQWQDRLAELIRLYTDSGKPALVILLDAVDQLLAGEDRDMLRFLPMELTDKVRIVLSCLDSFTLNRNMPVEDVPALAQTDRALIIRGILAPTGRSLSDEVIAAIAAKEGGEKPLYLSLLVTRLEMMERKDFEIINRNGGGMEQINRRQMDIIAGCSSDLGKLCVELIDAAAKKLGSTLPFVAAQFLAVSRYGLRETDLEQLLNQTKVAYDSLTFSQFRRYMSRFFIQREDGRIDFAHQSFRMGFRAWSTQGKLLHGMLAKHLTALPAKDPVVNTELPYHLICADMKKTFVNMVKVRRGFPSLIAAAARDAAEQTLADDGAWLLDLLHQGQALAVGEEFINFLSYSYPQGFRFSSVKALALQQKVLSEALAFARQLAQADPGTRHQERVAECCEALAVVHTSLGTREDQMLSQQYRQEALEIMQRLSEEDPDMRQILALRYYRLGQSYANTDDVRSLHKALELHEKALHIRREDYAAHPVYYHCRTLASSCYSVAGVCKSLGGRENLEKALALYQEGQALLQKLFDREQTLETRHDMAVSCQNIGHICIRLGGQENIQKALEAQLACAAHCEELVRLRGSVADRRFYASACDDVGSCYARFDEKALMPKALAWHRKAAAIGESLLQEVDTPEIVRLVATIYISIGDDHKELFTPEDLQQAKEQYGKGLALLEKLAQRLQTIPALVDYSTALERMGDVLRHIGGPENIWAALAYYEKALAELQQLAPRLSKPQSLRSLVIIHDRFGSTYELLHEQEKAMEAYLKQIAYAEEIVQVADTPESRQLLTWSYSNASILYSRMGGVENARKALELNRKSLQMRRELARELRTVLAYDQLATVMFRVAISRFVEKEEQAALLTEGKEIAEMLYRRTGNDRYQILLDRYTSALGH